MVRHIPSDDGGSLDSWKYNIWFLEQFKPGGKKEFRANSYQSGLAECKNFIIEKVV